MEITPEYMDRLFMKKPVNSILLQYSTKQDSELELTSAPHVYDSPGTYQIMVKVVDILGIDTSQVFEVTIE